MKALAVLLIFVFSQSTLASDKYLKEAKSYLTTLGHDADSINNADLIVGEFAYDLNDNGVNEIQVSPKCDFEKSCLKVIFSDNLGPKKILMVFYAYDYRPVKDAPLLNGYRPLIIYDWHGIGNDYDLYVWVSGHEKFLNCSTAIEMGIKWESQQWDCKDGNLKNP